MDHRIVLKPNALNISATRDRVLSVLDKPTKELLGELVQLKPDIGRARRPFFDLVVPQVFKAIEIRLDQNGARSCTPRTLANIEGLLKFIVNQAEEQLCSLPERRFVEVVDRLVARRGSASLARIQYWKADTTFELSKRYQKQDGQKAARVVDDLRQLGVDRILKREKEAPGVDGVEILGCVAKQYRVPLAKLKGAEPADSPDYALKGTFHTRGKLKNTVEIHTLPGRSMTWKDHPVEAAQVLLHEARHGIQLAVSSNPSLDTRLLRLSLSSQFELRKAALAQSVSESDYYKYYRDSLCERDARAFATQIVKALTDAETISLSASAFGAELRRALDEVAADRVTPPQAINKTDLDTRSLGVGVESEGLKDGNGTTSIHYGDFDRSLVGQAYALAGTHPTDNLGPLCARIEHTLSEPAPGIAGLKLLGTVVSELLARRSVGTKYSGENRRLLRNLSALAESTEQKILDEQRRVSRAGRRSQMKQVETTLLGLHDTELKSQPEFNETIDTLAFRLQQVSDSPTSTWLEIAQAVRRVTLKVQEPFLGAIPQKEFLKIASQVRTSLRERVAKSKNSEVADLVKEFNTAVRALQNPVSTH